MSKIREALLRTADWLETHRDQHIVSWRVSKRSEQLDPNPDDNPETDVCYCAAGRLAYEMGYGITDDGTRRIISPYPALYAQIYQINDEDASKRPFIVGRLRQGNPAVIPLLRKLAAE